jgi:hypothetical protein
VEPRRHGRRGLLLLGADLGRRLGLRLDVRLGGRLVDLLRLDGLRLLRLGLGRSDSLRSGDLGAILPDLADARLLADAPA